MKCYRCNGSGVDDDNILCYRCGGKGEIEQTNEEWFCGLSTKEKAKWLKESFDKCCMCALKQYDQRGECPFGRCRNGINEYEEWLKQPHRGEPWQRKSCKRSIARFLNKKS